MSKAASKNGRTGHRSKRAAPSPRRKPSARPPAKVERHEPVKRAFTLDGFKNRLKADTLREWASVYEAVNAELGLERPTTKAFVEAMRSRADEIEAS